MASSAVHSLDVNCKVHKVSWQYVSDNSRVFACYAQNLAVVARDAVTNVIMSDRNDDDIRIIGISEQICHFIPQEFDKFFANIEGLSISQSHLKEIKKDDFKQFPNVTELKFVRNDLEVLDSDVFEFTPKLVFLSVDFNKIKVIGLNTFDSVPVIRGIYAKKNVCIDDRSDYQPGTNFLIALARRDCVVWNAAGLSTLPVTFLLMSAAVTHLVI